MWIIVGVIVQWIRVRVEVCDIIRFSLIVLVKLDKFVTGDEAILVAVEVTEVFIRLLLELQQNIKR